VAWLLWSKKIPEILHHARPLEADGWERGCPGTVKTQCFFQVIPSIEFVSGSRLQ
jgi:hypothetical protein